MKQAAKEDCEHPLTCKNELITKRRKFHDTLCL